MSLLPNSANIVKTRWRRTLMRTEKTTTSITKPTKHQIIVKGTIISYTKTLYLHVHFSFSHFTTTVFNEIFHCMTFDMTLYTRLCLTGPRPLVIQSAKGTGRQKYLKNIFLIGNHRKSQDRLIFAKNPKIPRHLPKSQDLVINPKVWHPWSSVTSRISAAQMAIGDFYQPSFRHVCLHYTCMTWPLKGPDLKKHAH